MNTAAINGLRKSFAAYKLDALLITKEANIEYLSGFKGESGLLITPTKRILFVDFRFIEQARTQAKSFQLRQRESFCPLEKSLSQLSGKLKFKRLGLEGFSLSQQSYQKFKKALAPVKIVSTANIVEQLRAIKNAAEIKLLKKAASLAVRGFAFAGKVIKPGKKEKEVAAEVQYFMKKSGADDEAFDIIIASGKRSSMPHAPVSTRTIRNNEQVLVDLGCRISGYNSDLTRMVFLGRISDKLKRIYKVVLQAQELAIKAVKAGVSFRQVDKVARQYIAKEGLGAFFGHALGHGIGKEIHEYPSISPRNQDVLKENMVFTIEPGVYIPGLGGARVEDMVLVKKNGCEILTNNDFYKSI